MPGAGPVKVITDKAILGGEPGGELVLAALYRVTEQEVRTGSDETVPGRLGSVHANGEG
jgi:hypothetical protein